MTCHKRRGRLDFSRPPPLKFLFFFLVVAFKLDEGNFAGEGGVPCALVRLFFRLFGDGAHLNQLGFVVAFFRQDLKPLPSIQDPELYALQDRLTVPATPVPANKQLKYMIEREHKPD